MIGNAQLLVPRAPIADSLNLPDDLADIYSMFRLRVGYSGPCRRVRRSDNSETDIGFTAGGLYDIKAETIWAAGSDTYVTRWYNQSSYAGSFRAPYLEFTGVNASAPRGIVSSAAITIGSYPAIEFRDSSLMQPSLPAAGGYEEYLSVVFIGAATFSAPSVDAFLWSINADGAETSILTRVREAGRGTVVDYGPYDSSTEFTRPSGDFSSPSLIVTSYATGSPYLQTAWVNGSSRSASRSKTPSGVYYGLGLTIGPNVMHTLIIDGGGGRDIHDAAKASFNNKNWIY